MRDPVRDLKQSSRLRNGDKRRSKIKSKRRGKRGKNKQENSKANREHISSKWQIPQELAGATMEARNNQTDGEVMIGF